MKKLLIALLIIFLFLTGCWDQRELEMLSIVVGCAFDKMESGLFEVTIQIPGNLPSKDEGKGMQGWIISSGKGRTMFDATRNISLNLGKRNYWPHTEVVIVGEAMAKEDMVKVVDFFTRDSQRRRLVKFVVTDQEGKKLLSSMPKSEEITAMEIRNIITNYPKTGYGVESNLLNYLKETQSVSGVTLLDKFIVKKSDLPHNDPSIQDGNHSTEELIHDGTGVFYQNKLIGYLTLLETRSTNFLKNNIQSGILNLNIEEDDSDDEIGLEITKTETKLTPIIDGGRYTMKANLSIECNIVEYSAKENLLHISLQMLGQKMGKDVEKELITVFKKAKEELKVDLFQFGGIFQKIDHSILKLTQEEWREVFINTVELDLNVEVSIINSGVTLEEYH